MVEQRGPEVFDEIFAGDNPALKLETIKHLTAYGWGRPAQSVTVTHKAAGDVIMEAIERADRLRSEANITVAN